MKYGWLYIVMMVAMLALLVVAGWYRRSPVDAPGWLYLAFVLLFPVAIWVDVRHRRRKKH